MIENIKIEELPAELKRRIAELKELQTKKETLAKEIQQGDNQRKQELKNAKTAEEDLAKFKPVRERLGRRG